MLPTSWLLIGIVVVLFIAYEVLIGARFNWNKLLSGKRCDSTINRMRFSFHESRLHKAIVNVLNIQEEEPEHFEAILDKFSSFSDLSNAIKLAGVESSNIIIGVDFTASNEWQGMKSFDQKSLHCVAPFKKHAIRSSRMQNPYQRVMSAIGKVLLPYDDDNFIPVYGFGDVHTKDTGVFSFLPDDTPCKGFAGVEEAYLNVVEHIEMSGPTSFAPIINRAIEIVQEKGSYHILLIIADGQVEQEQDLKTRKAIVHASYYPLSIILVGVGDGPWDLMHTYDQKLPCRKFDNFQFVDFHQVTSEGKHLDKNCDIAFALNALMEIPDQYHAIKSLGMLLDSNKPCAENPRTSIERHVENLNHHPHRVPVTNVVRRLTQKEAH